MHLCAATRKVYNLQSAVVLSLANLIQTTLPRLGLCLHDWVKPMVKMRFVAESRIEFFPGPK